MTREDAIKMLRYNSNVIHQTMNGETDTREVEALDMAIKALEQEPTIVINGCDMSANNVGVMPSVTPSRQVIDDIKADIESARYGLINDGLDVALKIIDKHISGKE